MGVWFFSIAVIQLFSWHLTLTNSPMERHLWDLRASSAGMACFWVLHIAKAVLLVRLKISISKEDHDGSEVVAQQVHKVDEALHKVTNYTFVYGIL